jgi:hypothetical protein
MRQLAAAASLSVGLLLLCAATQGPPSKIFPPLPAAQSAANWKDGYFVINGKPTFINSGSIHYARAPPAMANQSSSSNAGTTPSTRADHRTFAVRRLRLGFKDRMACVAGTQQPSRFRQER